MRARWNMCLILLALAGLLVAAGCGKEQTNEETCPSFSDYQLYPPLGTGDSVYELLVMLRDRSANQDVEKVYADLYSSNDQYAGRTFDLVRLEADHLRYLLTFQGSEVCESGTCSLFFKVFAKHPEGCIKSFQTDIFQVVIGPETDDDNDAASDDDTTPTPDDDTTPAADDDTK